MGPINLADPHLALLAYELDVLRGELERRAQERMRQEVAARLAAEGGGVTNEPGRDPGVGGGTDVPDRRPA